MNNAYNELPADEINEDEMEYTIGDSILLQFYYGNFTDAINMMITNYVEPKDLFEYLEERAEEYGCGIDELYGNHFTMSFAGQVGEAYRDAR